MRRIVVIAGAALALAAPTSAQAANPGSDNAGECGAYHGMFAMPAHGFLQEFVPVFAKSGVYKGGFVGDNARNPACHSRPD